MSTSGAPPRRRGLLSSLRAGVGAPWVAMRRTVRDPRLRRLQLAWAAVMVASWTVKVSLSVVAFTEGGSLAVAVAVIARTLPILLAGSAVGALADRLPARWCLFGAAAVCTAGAAGAAFAGQGLLAVVALAAAVGLATAQFRTALAVLLPQLVDEPADLTTANVLISASKSFGLFAGPALAGVLLAVQGPPSAFAAAALLFALAAVLVVGLRPRAAHTLAPPASTAALRDVLRHGTARLLLVLTLVQTVVAGGLVVLYPSLAVNALDLDPSAVGFLTAAFGLGGVIGSLGLFALAGSSRLGLAQACAMLVWSVPLLLLPLVPTPAAVVALLLLVGVGSVLFDVTCTVLLQRSVPAQLLGRSFGILEVVVVLGTMTGAALAPLLEGLLGPAGAVAVLAAPLAVVAPLALRRLRRLDRELAAPSRQVTLLRGFPAFALLNTLQLERLALNMAERRVSPQEVVARQGEPGSTWFVVEDGALDVDVDGRTVGSMAAGESFGEVALVRKGPRTATVTATTSTTLWSLAGEVFLAGLGVGDSRALAVVDAVVAERLARASPAAASTTGDDPAPGVVTRPRTVDRSEDPVGKG